MDELTTITEYIQGQAGDEAEVIFGHGVDSALGDRIRVTVIATGFITEGKLKKEDKKVRELDKSQTSLFGTVDNSVNQQNAELQLKLKTDGDRPILKDDTLKEEIKSEKKLPEMPKENLEEKSYTFELFRKEEQPIHENEEGEASLFAEEDEFEVGKEISADQVINDDGLMEVRKTKARLEQQAKERREKLKSKKQEMTKEDFNEKW